MIWQNKDGELRIYEHGGSGVTYYLEILFTDANLSGPLARPRTEEILCTDRGKLDTNASYRQGYQSVRAEPMPLTFTCRTADTDHSDALKQWMSGCTKVRTKQLYSRKAVAFAGSGVSHGGVPIPGISATNLPDFADSTGKYAYLVETLWSKSGSSNLGVRWDAVHFPPSEQTITEGEEAITLNLNGQIFGGVTTIMKFTSGCSNIATN